MKGLKVTSPLLILTLAAQAALADTEFGDSVPREVVVQFISGNQVTGGEGRLYSDIFDAFPDFTLPPDFTVLASADQGYSQRVILKTSVDAAAAKAAVAAAFTAEGWQELPAYGRDAPQVGFVNATPPAQPLSFCNDAFGRISIGVSAGAVPRYVSISHNTNRNGLQQSCAEEIEMRALGPDAMRGPQGQGLSEHMPRLIMPESPTPAPPVYGGSGGSPNDWETHAPLTSEWSADAILQHFTDQVDEQGWAKDFEVSGTTVATASWTKTVDGMDLIGLLTILETADDTWDIKFRIVRKSTVGGSGTDRVPQRGVVR